MKVRTLTVALGLLVVTPTHAGAPDVARLAVHLWDSEPDVRNAAVAALLAHGERVRTVLGEKEGTIASLQEQAGTEERVRVEGTLDVMRRLSTRERDSVAFWIDVETLVERESGTRLRAAVAAGSSAERDVDAVWRDTAAEETLVRRDRARALVHEYCRDYRQVVGIGSPEQANNERLKKALAELGPSAAPHLLRVLAFNPHKTFVGAVPGAPATAQVAAILAVSDLRLRESVAHLVYQAAVSPSYTAATNAAAALGRLADAKVEPRGTDTRTSVLAWWQTHRSEHRESLRWVLLSVLAELRMDAAREAIGFEDVARGDMGEVVGPAFALAKALPRIAGEGFPLRWEGDAYVRLTSVRATEAWVTSTLGR